VIVCCSAGYGLRQDPPSQFIGARMLSVFPTLRAIAFASSSVTTSASPFDDIAGMRVRARLYQS
jgi:hypothetical protein